LTELQLITAFHAFLKGALSQAHAERLLTDEMLASAEADLMVEGPALCLFFAALRSTTHPPSVILPSPAHAPPLILDITTCPPAFLPLFRLWSSTVPPIRALPPQYQHDLARLLCDLDPLTSPVRQSLPRLAAELRAVAIEISQRRTFQERYGGDLQAQLRTPPNSARLAVPPSPLRPSSPSTPSIGRQSSPLRATFPPSPSSPSLDLSTPATPDPVLALIRETLYAALADVLALTPALKPLLVADPAQAYFASVGLAILSVCLTQISQDGEVRGVLGRVIREEEVPLDQGYRAFMAQLVRIALRAQLMSEEDDARAVRYLAQDRALPTPRLDRLRKQLLEGAGAGLAGDGAGSTDADADARAHTPSGTVTALANRINVVALQWVRLRAFRDRQGEVFDVLSG
ncbi:hypothetical protein CALCODRAFT_411650, partial [Calocera cornea HHB12733]